MMKCMKNNKKKAFTLAEILLSLTVIGIVAAIALPSLLGNANERAWATQKKALHTRMSQAIPLLPSVNGYGQLVGEFAANQYAQQSVTADNAAETFVRDGLSKVMKMTNICTIPYGTSGTDAATKLKDCGLPDKIVPSDGVGTIYLSGITTMQGLNQKYVGNTWNQGDYEQLNTNAAAFETPNGESVLVYYNPQCKPDLLETSGRYIQPKMCVNFVYDLNGIKGPNTVGKDIGFMTVFYSTDSTVVAPIPLPNTISSVAQTAAANKCKEVDADSRVPNLEEAGSLFTNKYLLSSNSVPTQTIWTSTSPSSGKAWAVSLSDGYTTNSSTSDTKNLRCIKR